MLPSRFAGDKTLGVKSLVPRSTAVLRIGAMHRTSVAARLASLGLHRRNDAIQFCIWLKTVSLASPNARAAFRAHSV